MQFPDHWITPKNILSMSLNQFLDSDSYGIFAIDPGIAYPDVPNFYDHIQSILIIIQL